jgi:hypothetical protein
MGRYDAGEFAPGSMLYEVHLMGVPVPLFLAARQHHDELMREFAVLALAHQEDNSADPPELRRLVRELGVHSAAPEERPDVEEAAAAGLPTVDLTFRVTVGILAMADRFQALMKSADEFCAQGRMLTMPRSPEVLRFASWWFGEIRGQVAGNPPVPWAGEAADA